MRYGQALIVIVGLLMAGGLFLLGADSRSAAGGEVPAASGSPSPSASPTISPSPVVKPASANVVHWARHWRHAAVRSWRQWNRARSAFGLRVVPLNARSARAPNRAASNARWMDAGRGWKHDRGVYHAKFTRLWQRMNNPGGSGWERWRPLVCWVWPRSLVSTVIEIMHWESGGALHRWNWGGSGAFGFLQLLPKPAGVWTALEQLEYAYHHKYLPAGGFGPWAGCRAFL